MKTVERAAKECLYSDKEFYNSLSQSERELIVPIFKQGVEFAQHWIPVSEKMPEKLKMVLVKCNNKGIIYTTAAQFVPEKTVLASDFLSDAHDWEGCAEYNEDVDDYYVVRGWWEYQTEVDINWKISSEVTHWRPIELR